MKRCALALALVAIGCGRRAEDPHPRAAAGCEPVNAARVGNRWSVELAVDGSVLRAHGARFRRLGIEPNGEAWAGLLEQCLAKEGAPLPRDVELDPEASSLHAWAASDSSKERLVDSMCRAATDAKWLDVCLAKIDRSKLDD